MARAPAPDDPPLSQLLGMDADASTPPAYDDLLLFVIKVARGRDDNGRPLGGPLNMDEARTLLMKHKINWTRLPDRPLRK